MTNDLLKSIAKEAGMEELAVKENWNHQEYMSVVMTDQWQKRMSAITSNLKKNDPTW